MRKPRPGCEGIAPGADGKTRFEVNVMADKKYPDLFALIAADSEAKMLYDKLPSYVKAQMSQRADSINSIESLSDYADNLTRGDG